MKILNYLGRGILHERQGLPCQDAIGYAAHENGNVVLALADGAGGSKYAQEAAQANVDALIGYFREHPAAAFRTLEPREGARAVISACLDQLRLLARELEGCQSADLCATLLFALWDGEVLTLGHLGDGMILVLDTNGRRSLLSPPERRGEDPMGTWFTVSPGADAHLRLYHCSAEQSGGFLMTSDGACGMLQSKGRGLAEDAAAVLLELVRTEELNTSAELARFLYLIAQQPGERLDDWSFLIGCPGMSSRGEELQPMISMLGEEYERMKQDSGSEESC